MDEAVVEIARTVRNAGGRAFLVGGCVRDGLMPKSGVKDFDIEVFGLMPDVLRTALEGRFRLDLVGLSFGVLKIHGHDIDVSLPRRESKHGTGHKGFLIDSDPFMSVKEAATRRDFTVNAIYLDPLTGEYEDPWGGKVDLANGVLRHVSEKFAEDPLRVLRGMQFASRMDFTFAAETVELCSSISQEELARERIGTEWEKLFLQGVKPSAGLEFLKACSWSRFYPELEALPEEAWRQTLQLLDRCALKRSGERQQDLLFMGAAASSFLTPSQTESFCSRLWNRSELVSKITALAAAFREEWEKDDTLRSPAEIRRLALRLDGVKLLCALLDAAGIERKSAAMAACAKEEKVLESAPRPLLTGRHGIESGLRHGEMLGKVLKQCFEAQLDGVFYDLEGGKRYLEKLLKSGENREI
jgi:tRNA nucleotidyltransferase (CCA-adding enzyme)